MFVLSRMVDTVRIKPDKFGLEFHKALVYELNQKFANKVSHFNSLFDFLVGIQMLCLGYTRAETAYSKIDFF